jgi:hypothetical protein
MEMEYTKKDIKKSPKMKKVSKSKIVKDESGKQTLWKFELNGQTHGFGSEEHAIEALERMSNE